MLPFPTELLGRYGETTLGTVIYASAMTVAGGSMVLLWWYMRHANLAPRTSHNLYVLATWRGAIPPLVFAVSIPIAFIDADVRQARLDRHLAVEHLPRDPLRQGLVRQHRLTARRSQERRRRNLGQPVDLADPVRRRGARHPTSTRGGAPMRYALLICDDETADEAMSPDEGQAQMAEYMEFGEEMSERGVAQGGERLRPTTDATTVQVRDGEVLTSDGPFAETKEQIGGFYLVDCKDLDEAIEVASKIPGAQQRLDRSEADLGDVAPPTSRPRSPTRSARSGAGSSPP